MREAEKEAVKTCRQVIRFVCVFVVGVRLDFVRRGPEVLSVKQGTRCVSDGGETNTSSERTCSHLLAPAMGAEYEVGSCTSRAPITSVPAGSWLVAGAAMMRLMLVLVSTTCYI